MINVYVDILSLDHDLVKYICENGIKVNKFPITPNRY